MNIAIYTITSELHDAKSIDATTRAFLESLDITYDMRGNDFSDYGSHALDLIYIRTGGTEGIFKPLFATAIEATVLPADIGQEQFAGSLDGNPFLP